MGIVASYAVIPFLGAMLLALRKVVRIVAGQTELGFLEQEKGGIR